MSAFITRVLFILLLLSFLAGAFGLQWLGGALLWIFIVGMGVVIAVALT